MSHSPESTPFANSTFFIPEALRFDSGTIHKKISQNKTSYAANRDNCFNPLYTGRLIQCYVGRVHLSV